MVYPAQIIPAGDVDDHARVREPVYEELQRSRRE